MVNISKKELKDFTDKIFGTDEEIEEGIRERSDKPKISESVLVQGTLFSKDKWTVENLEK
jgi:hypothetical protein